MARKRRYPSASQIAKRRGVGRYKRAGLKKPRPTYTPPSSRKVAQRRGVGRHRSAGLSPSSASVSQRRGVGKDRLAGLAPYPGASKAETRRHLNLEAHRAKAPGKQYYYTSQQGKRQDARSEVERAKALAAGLTLPDPKETRKQALKGIDPPKLMRKTHPRAYREQMTRAMQARDKPLETPKTLGVPDAELATGAVTGVGGMVRMAVKTAGKLGAKTLGKTAVKEGAEAVKEAGKQGGKKAAKRTAEPKKAYRETVSDAERGIKGDVPKSKPKVRVKPGTRERVRMQPKARVTRVKDTAKPKGTSSSKPTRVSRRGKVARPSRAGRRRSMPRRAARTAVRHPILSAAALGATGKATGIDNKFTRAAGATVEGFATADPLKAGKATARAVPGIISGIAKPVVGAVQSSGRAVSTAGHAAGMPLMKGYSGKEIVSPTTETVSELAKGSVEMAKPFLSGDPEKVREAVESEVGYIPLVPVPKIVSAARRSRPYRGARGRVRDRVADARDRRDTRRQAQDKRVKPRVRDTKSGPEEYVFRGLGRKIENRRARKLAAREISRAQDEAKRYTALDAKQVTRQVAKVRVPLTARAKTYRQQAGAAVAVAARYGLPRDPSRALEYLQQIKKGIGKPAKGELRPGAVTDRTVIRFLEENPAVLGDKAFWKAVEAYKKVQGPITTSQVNKYRAVGGTYKVASVEQRMKRGVEVNGETVKVKPMTPETRARKLAEAENVMEQARKTERAANKLLGNARSAAEMGPGSTLVRISQNLRDRAKAIRREVDLHEQAREVAGKQYVAEVQGIIKRDGLETPAYVKEVAAVDKHAPEIQRRDKGMAQAEHASGDVLRRRGMSDRSLGTTLTESIAGPRTKRVLHKLTTNLFERGARHYDIGGKRKKVLTSDEVRRLSHEGKLDLGRHDALVDAAGWKQAFLDKNRPLDQLAADIRDVIGFDGKTRIRREIQNLEATPGHKYMVVNRDLAREVAHQLTGRDEGMMGALAKANQIGSRAVLGYNPTWLEAQVLAEGLPAATAIGANPARWWRIGKAYKDIRKMDSESRAAIDATAGRSFGAEGITRPGASRLDPHTAADLTAGERGIRRTLDLLTGRTLGKADKAKGGVFRKAVALAKVDKETHGFLSGLRNSLKVERELNAKMKNMTLAERMEYIARNPQTAARLEKYVDDIMGNWRAITRLERGPASLTAFYPFVRYSLKWAFWTFPKQHPIKASMLYWLSQQNANELEQLIGGPPASWLDYAFPVISADGDKQIMKSATRIAPATNSIINAIGQGTVNQVANTLSPILGAGVTAITGQDPFTGNKVTASPQEAGRAGAMGQHVLLGLAALTSMVAPIRWADDLGLPGPTDFKPRKQYRGGTVIGGLSDTSKKLRKLDPNRTARGSYNIYAHQSGDDYKSMQEILRELNASYAGTSSDPTRSATPADLRGDLFNRPATRTEGDGRGLRGDLFGAPRPSTRARRRRTEGRRTLRQDLFGG